MILVCFERNELKAPRRDDLICWRRVQMNLSCKIVVAYLLNSFAEVMLRGWSNFSWMAHLGSSRFAVILRPHVIWLVALLLDQFICWHRILRWRSFWWRAHTVVWPQCLFFYWLNMFGNRFLNFVYFRQFLTILIILERSLEYSDKPGTQEGSVRIFIPWILS